MFEKLATLTSIRINQRIWTHDNFLLLFLVSYSHHRNFANLLQTPIWPLHKCLDRKRYCLHKQKCINSKEKKKRVQVWKRIYTYTNIYNRYDSYFKNQWVFFICFSLLLYTKKNHRKSETVKQSSLFILAAIHVAVLLCATNQAKYSYLCSFLSCPLYLWLPLGLLFSIVPWVHSLEIAW